MPVAPTVMSSTVQAAKNLPSTSPLKEQGEDKSKYLNTDPYGDYSLAGSIFLDSRNTSDFSDSYNLTYGHHMSNHLMFGALDRFYDERYFEQHSSGTLRVGELVYPLQIFAVLATDAGESVLFQPQGSGHDS